MADKPAVERVHPPTWLIRLVNPLVRRLILRGKGRIAEQLAVLEFTGRKSGRQYQIPVAYRHVDGRLAVLTNSPWRVNLRDRPEVSLVLRGQRTPATAELVEDPQTVAALYDRLISEAGRARPNRELDIRINVDRAPTIAELQQLSRDSGLSILWLDTAPTTNG